MFDCVTVLRTQYTNTVTHYFGSPDTQVAGAVRKERRDNGGYF